MYWCCVETEVNILLNIRNTTGWFLLKFYFKQSAEQNYKTFNIFELIIPANFEIWCSGGRVAADAVGLSFDVMQCRVAGI
jgi:hypothetical protein